MLRCTRYIIKENQLFLKDFRTLKNKIFKHMAAILKNVYFNVLDDIINK